MSKSIDRLRFAAKRSDSTARNKRRVGRSSTTCYVMHSPISLH